MTRVGSRPAVVAAQKESRAEFPARLAWLAAEVRAQFRAARLPAS